MFNLASEPLKGAQRHVHFIGIGGMGLSPLARWFLAKGWKVSGSDLLESQITKDLRKDGVRIYIGDSAKHLKHPGLVVVSQAIPKTSKELQAAKKAKMPVLARPAAVGELTRTYDTIAIAGAHGKSTTSALAALLLIRAELDPTVIVGTKLRELKEHNFRKGGSEWLVLEADEYGRAFLDYSPLYAIVTNIDREHLDIYGNLTNVKAAFLKFMGNVREGGALILNADDKNLASLRSRIEKSAKKNSVQVFWYSLRSSKAKTIASAMKVPGRHNVSNAMAVYTLATRMFHIPEKTILASFKDFNGTWRRAEHRGDLKLPSSTHYPLPTTYSVFDDYAHHPTEIKTTLQGFKEKYPGATLVCVFQPHQAERLKRLFKEFVRSFSDADAVFFFPEYRVAGRDNATSKKRQVISKYTAKTLAEAVKRKYPKQTVGYIDDPKKLSPAYLAKFLSANCKLPTANFVVIMMGAGNIVDYTGKLLKRNSVITE